MEQYTRLIFESGEENRAVARLLATQETDIASAARRWATICAFYAVVHYVNAWLWENVQIEPRDHAERRSFIASMAALKPIASAYIRLQERGYDARYRVGFQITAEHLTDLLEHDLQQIRSVIVQSLNAGS